MWEAMAGEGWLGIHLPEDHGGQGFGLFELAVLLEETGWAVDPRPAAPHRGRLGAVLPVPARRTRPTGSLPGFADGTCPRPCTWGRTRWTRCGAGVRRPARRCRAPCDRCWAWARPGSCWCPPPPGTGRRPGACSTSTTDRVRASALPSLDATRRVGRSRWTASRCRAPASCRECRPAGSATSPSPCWPPSTPAVPGGASRRPPSTPRCGCSSAGPSASSRRSSTGLADMAVRVEQLAVGGLGRRAGRRRRPARATPGADDGADDGPSWRWPPPPPWPSTATWRCAQDCLQVLGGIGFTWEHDPHLHLKRALADRQLLGGGDAAPAAAGRRGRRRGPARR